MTIEFYVVVGVLVWYITINIVFAIAYGGGVVMTRDFIRPNGNEVTVKFTYCEDSGPTYSPLTGADGGDSPECEIVRAWVGDTDVELTDEERERYEEAICSDPPEPDYD